MKLKAIASTPTKLYGRNSGKSCSHTKINAGLSAIKPNPNEDPVDRWRTNGFDPVPSPSTSSLFLFHSLCVTLSDFFFGSLQEDFEYGIYYGVFWVNIAKSEVNLRYRNCSNLFEILRREIEFRYYRCQNSTKSMRGKKKKVERENVEFRQQGYRISYA